MSLKNFVTSMSHILVTLVTSSEVVRGRAEGNTGGEDGHTEKIFLVVFEFKKKMRYSGTE